MSFPAPTPLLALSLLAAVLSTACQQSSAGTNFEVSANLESNTCGGGAVEAEDEWDRKVSVEIDDDVIRWTDEESGKTLEGSLSDGSFLITDSWTAVTTEDAAGAASCTVLAHLRYVGTVEGTTEPTDLEGELSITYSEAADSDCTALVGQSAGFAQLPCDLTYTFDGDLID